MLSGVRVLEIGETVPVAAAGAMLRKFGADVVRLRDGETDGSVDGTQRGRLLAALAVGKRELVVDDPWGPASIQQAGDVAITIADVEARASLDGYDEYVRASNRATWVTVSPFGLHGSLSGKRGGELVAVASGGIAYYMRSTAGRPMKPAGFGASIAAGHFAALAGLHGTLALRWGREPIHLDLSMQDAVLVLGVFLELSHVVFESASEGSSKNYAAPSGFIRCADGLVWITVLERHHWEGCVRAAGSPDWAVRIATDEQRYAESESIRQRLEDWSGLLTAEECADRLQAEGVPATKVNSCTDLLASAGRDVAADFFVPGSRADELLPGLPVRLTARRGDVQARKSGAAAPRLLDVTGVLVAPLATSWLGTIGVDVLKIEDPTRTDVYRRVGPFVHRKPDPEASAYFSFVNYSKRSYAVRLDEEEGRRRLRDLAVSADVVVTNVSAHRAETLGLTPSALDELGAAGPSLVSSAGFGRSTAHAAYRAYGLNIQAAGGIVHLSRDRDGQPRNFGTSWADPMTAIVIALSAMAQILAPEGRRHHAEVSMVEVLACQLPEYFASTSTGGEERVADENRMDHAAPHDVYRCADDEEWIAIVVETDEEWQRLVEALGDPEELRGARFSRREDRAASAAELDDALGRVLARRPRGEVFAGLQDAGIACAPVWGARELVALDHLRERGALQAVSHPVWGERLLAGVPWRVAEEGALPIGVPPLLGEHTSEDPQRWWSTGGHDASAS
jgi:crotonobetainyl-CoA:carnitine CoA-transferase CaiB-like acyl-CoA transferase